MGSAGWTASEGVEEVRCRRTGLWAASLVCALFGALLVFAAPFMGSLGAGLLFGLFLGGPFLGLAAWGILYSRRAEIVADAAGLRWRGTGRWREAKWAEVSDYCWFYPPAPSSTSSATSGANVRWLRVQTWSGTLTLVPGGWTNLEAFRACIARNAMEVGAPGWRVVGETPLNLPLKCHYDTAINRHTLRAMDRLHVFGLAAVVIYFGWQWWTTHTLPGWEWLLTPTGVFVVAKQTLPLLIRSTYRETQRRLGEKIVAEKAGLRFLDSSGETWVPWEDVSDFYWEGLRYVVVTPEGERDFLGTLTNSEQLKAVIPQLATRAGQTRWRTGTPRLRRVRGTDGEETTRRIYHYRSQDNCGRLWTVTFGLAFLGLVFAGPALIAFSSGTTPSGREWALAACGLFGFLLLLWAWAAYWTGAFWIDDEGLTQRTVWDKRFLPWDQVCGFRWRGTSDLTWGCVEGRYGQIGFWREIGDGDRLADEIVARAGAGETLTARPSMT